MGSNPSFTAQSCNARHDGAFLIIYSDGQRSASVVSLVRLRPGDRFTISSGRAVPVGQPT